MSRDSALIWYRGVRHVASSCDIALVGNKALVQRATGRASEFNLEIREHHLRDAVVAALRIV